MVYIHSGILLSHKKNEIVPFIATWMDLEIIILSEVSQTEKATYYMISLSCRIKKIDLLYDPAILLLDMYPQNTII